jgi:phosphopantothenoylcysteine decarboxylase/phosphopantothenate--cysteine ligase
MAPAMNVRMWEHPATKRNLATLKRDGVRMVGPNEGDMACGEFGYGRMAEPHEIVAAIEVEFAPAAKPLAGKKVMITAGPTREPIDPVRYISNHSSGKQGYAIAEAAVALGAETVLVSGPVSLPLPPGAQVMPVETAQDMLEICEAELPCDIAVFTAAVADWRVDKPAAEKIKRNASGSPEISLTQNPDILKTIAAHKSKRPALVVGFAAETENIVKHARDKLAKKGCDLIVANNVSAETGVMGGERNTVHLVSASGVESWPEMSKREVAFKLMQRLADQLAPKSKAAE